MIKLGEMQELSVIRSTDHGIYLEDDTEENGKSVLLPKNQVTDAMTVGSSVNVFIYKDSEDRIIATTTTPKITIDTLALLEVKEVNVVGAFLDWGLPKDLLLPFKEQKNQVAVGDKVLAKLYIDKSFRLCATTKVYDILSCDSLYQKGEKVNGTIFDINSNYGAFVAVDDKYLAMLPANEYFIPLSIGQNIEARVTEVRPDGKLNLSLRAKINVQMDEDSKLILTNLIEHNGYLPYNDKTAPDIIKREFALSKNSFKRAIGRMYKQGQIVIKDDGIYVTED